MKQNLTEQLRTSLAKMSPEAELAAYIAGVTLALPFAITGAAYALAYGIKVAPKVIEAVSNNPLVEYVTNNPYETTLGVAGVAALGAGLYSYVERKLHVAKTLDDFVEKTKMREKPVDLQFQFGEPLLGSDEKSIVLRSGKVRYSCNYGDLGDICVHPYRGYSVRIGYAKEIAMNCLDNIESVIHLAEDLKQRGFEVRINGGTIVNGPVSIDSAKEYLAACKEGVENGNAFIIG